MWCDIIYLSRDQEGVYPGAGVTSSHLPGGDGMLNRHITTTGRASIELGMERLVRSRLQWAGHVETMADDRLPTRAAELREKAGGDEGGQG